MEERGEKWLGYGMAIAAGFVLCLMTTDVKAADFNKGDELLKQMHKELRVDTVASRQDKRMNRMKVALTVEWKLNADMEIHGSPKYRIHANNNGFEYTRQSGWEMKL